MTRPTLTVAVTYFEEGELLRDCITSIASQDPPVDEILVYDDASRDPAEAHLPELARVRIIRGERNAGTPAAGRNRMLAAANSELIHFHDADDLFATGWSAEVLAAFEDNRIDCVFTEVASLDEAGRSTPQVLGLSALRADADLLGFCLRGAMLVPAGTYRRELVERVGGYREHIVQSEDYDFHVRLARLEPRYRVIEEDLVIIRVRAAGRSADRSTVWSCAVDTLLELEPELGANRQRDIGIAAEHFGRELFALGEHKAADRAFALASRVGARQRRSGRSPYDLAVKYLGYRAAEGFGRAYRALLPSRLRARLRNGDE